MAGTEVANAEIVPFRIELADEVLDDLRRRLLRTRWPDQLPDAGGDPWALGSDGGYLRELIDYWVSSYDWREHERKLNRLDQFVTEIDGQRLHFVHQRSAESDATPLVLLSGWPSTFAEFAALVPLLTQGPGRRFHVVAPSLPGFGFSGPTHETGWTPKRIAGAVAELMTRLGYNRYCVHGGDWGSMVASQLALADNRCAGIHLSMVIAPKPPEGAGDLTDAERADVATMHAAGAREMGYQQIQGTRPQTLSVALFDSPAGLAAWIVEKFRAWGDCRGDIESRFSKDVLLTNLTIYWATGTIASANRIYAETRRAGRGASLPDEFVTTPLGYTRFPADGFKPPRAWVERLYNVARWSDVDEGGHFPALEVPALLARELREFVDAVAALDRSLPVARS